jgi:hypothetical protein
MPPTNDPGYLNNKHQVLDQYDRHVLPIKINYKCLISSYVSF